MVSAAFSGLSPMRELNTINSTLFFLLTMVNSRIQDYKIGCQIFAFAQNICRAKHHDFSQRLTKHNMGEQHADRHWSIQIVFAVQASQGSHTPEVEWCSHSILMLLIDQTLGFYSILTCDALLCKPFNQCNE